MTCDCTSCRSMLAARNAAFVADESRAYERASIGEPHWYRGDARESSGGGASLRLGWYCRCSSGQRLQRKRFKNMTIGNGGVVLRTPIRC